MVASGYATEESSATSKLFLRRCGTCSRRCAANRTTRRTPIRASRLYLSIEGVSMLDEWLEEKLHTRRDKGLHRALPQASGLTDFTSNDYFGLARNEALHILIKEVVSGLPVQNGATGSRLLSGNSAFADK